MPSPSKAKGSGWENEVAKYLSALYEESFIRAPSSGAFVGGKNASRKEFLHEGQIRVFKGDIVPPMHWRHFNAEAKFYKDFPWHQLFTGKCAILDAWIDQQYAAADPGDFNIMFLKFNRQGKFIAVEAENFLEQELPANYTMYSSNKTETIWMLCNFEEFLDLHRDFIKARSQAPSQEKLVNPVGTLQ